MKIKAFGQIFLISIAPVTLAEEQPPAPALYELTASRVLESSNTPWDYIKMEPGGNRLFMARVADGLSVFNVDNNQLITTVENSVGANGPLILPEYGVAYVAMTDGSLLTVDLDTLEPLARVPLTEDGGLNSAVYDPVSGHLYAITGFRPEYSTWFILDPATGELLGTKKFPFQKMDDPAIDGKGNIYAPARLDNLVLKLDSHTLEEHARWEAPCNVAKVHYQESTHRILAACLEGSPVAHPEFFAMDADSGEIVSRIPIGRVADALVVDEQRNRIVVASGVDGSLTVIEQRGPDDYSALARISTRPGARMMALDSRTGKLYLVTADFEFAPGFDPAIKGRAPEYVFLPDSFVVLEYSPN